MGAGNVKAARPEPAPLRVTSPEPVFSSVKSPPDVGGSRVEDHVSPPWSPLSPAGKRWDVTCDVHRGLICRFCGGKSCKHEDWRRQKDTPAIAGLHSTWVSANVLGMQRPSSRLIRQYNVVDSMKKAGIGAVFNLQLAGEHPYCGDGIDATGFSYRAEDFTDHGIFYYNPGWVDMNIPSLERMLEIVQMMMFHTSRSQKVAVHCHAGYGRTGIVIACFFVYAYGLAPAQAIKSVRDRRPGSVQTSKQQKFVAHFAEYVHYLRTVFYPPTPTPFMLKHAASPRAKAALASAGLMLGGGHANSAAPDIVDDLSSDEEDALDDSATSFNLPSFARGGLAPSGTPVVPWPQAAGCSPVKGKAFTVPLQSGGNLFPRMLLSRRHALLMNLLVNERSALLLDRYTLHECLSRQRAVLHGAERATLRLVPKVVAVLTERLLDLAEHAPALLACALLEGFRRGAALDRLFEREFDKEKERRRARNKALDPSRASNGQGALSGVNSHATNANGTPTKTTQAQHSQQRSVHAHEDGALAALSAHGTMAHSSLFDFAGGDGRGGRVRRTPSPETIHVPQLADGSAHGDHFRYGSESFGSGGPGAEKWGMIQEDVYASLKRKVNAGEWSALENCDQRYCAQLLLEWLDELRTPLLPLFERPKPDEHSNSNGGNGPAVSPSLFASPHSILYASPLVFFASLPRWSLHAVDPLMRMLHHLRHLEAHTVARVYARVGFALTHPRAALPDSLLVHRSHASKTQAILAHKLLGAGLSIQVLHQAAQAAIQANVPGHALSSPAISQMSEFKTAARSSATSAATVVASTVAVASSGANFDGFHSLLAAPKPLLDTLVEFLASLSRSWHPLYSSMRADEERLAASQRVGVRRAEHVEASVAQKHEGALLVAQVVGAAGGADAPLGGSRGNAANGAAGQSHLLPYQLEPTKLSAVTQTAAGGGGGAASRAGALLRRASSDDGDASLLLDGRTSELPEVSTTTYLHSHIHHAQPQDRSARPPGTMLSPPRHSRHAGGASGGTGAPGAGASFGVNDGLSLLEERNEDSKLLPHSHLHPGGLHPYENSLMLGGSFDAGSGIVGGGLALGGTPPRMAPPADNRSPSPTAPLPLPMQINQSTTPALDDKEERLSGFLTARSQRAAALAAAAAATGGSPVSPDSTGLFPELHSSPSSGELSALTIGVPAIDGAPLTASSPSSSSSTATAAAAAASAAEPKSQRPSLLLSPCASQSTLPALAHSLSAVDVAVPATAAASAASSSQAATTILPPLSGGRSNGGGGGGGGLGSSSSRSSLLPSLGPQKEQGVIPPIASTGQTPRKPARLVLLHNNPAAPRDAPLAAPPLPSHELQQRE